MLRYQLPEQVLPCQFTEGTFTFRINAPSREVQVIAVKDGSQPVIVSTHRNPNGVFDVKLTSEHVAVDQLGGITVGLSVGQTEKQRGKQAGGGAPSQPTIPGGPTPTAPGPSPPAMGPVPTPTTTEAGPSDFDNSSWQIDYVRLTVAGETL